MLDRFKTRFRAAICARRISTFAQFHTYGQIRLVDYAAQHADLLQNGFYTPQESSTEVKEDSLLMQLLKVRGE